MIIDLTETRLPIGYTKDDLGEAVSIISGMESLSASSNTVVLISYQSSPIVINYEQTYTLFILDANVAEQIDHIVWSADLAADGSDTHTIEFTPVSDTCIKLVAEEAGELIISAEIFYISPSIPNDIITLTQQVKTNFLEMIPKVNGDYCSFGTPTTTNYLVDNYFTYLLQLTNSTTNSYGELRFFVASIIYTTLLQNKNTFTEPSVNSVLNFSSEDFTEGIGLEQLRPYLLLYLFGEELTDPETSPTPWYDQLITYSKSDSNQQAVITLFTDAYNNISEEQKIDFYNLLRFPASCLLVCRDYLVFLKDKFYPADTFKICFDTPAKRNALINQFYMGPYDNTIDFSKNPNDYSKTILKDHSANMNALIPAISFLKKMLFSERYGSYQLQKDDSDATYKYGGEIRSLADIEFTSNANGHTTVPKFINNLKNDLYLLGFNIMKSDTDLTAGTGTELANGNYDLHTQWAVREFQVYASLSNTAKLKTSGATAPSDGDNLESVANTLIYTGPKSGVLNDETKIVLQYWLDNNYHCPVVISAFNMSGAIRLSLHTDNIWLYNHVHFDGTGPIMYARDFTNHYHGYDPASDGLLTDWIPLGHYAKYSTWGGAKVPFAQSWPSCDITFDNLTGITRNASDATQASILSTFKMLHVISDAEAGKRYDVLNFWDSGVVSWGIPHWTLHYEENGNELGGTFYFLKQFYPTVFESAFAAFGIVNVDHRHNTSLKTFAGQIYVENEAGEAVMASYEKNQISYYKCWHFVYRFAMSLRIFTDTRSLMWNLLRKRLSDVLELSIGGGVMVKGTSTPAKIKDVFTSEKVMAMIFRWHVNAPSSVDGKDTATLANHDRFWKVLKGVGTSPTNDDLSSSYDSNESQVKLADRWEHQINTDSNPSIKDFPDTVNAYVYTHGTETSVLSTDHGSFQFYDTGIPEFI